MAVDSLKKVKILVLGDTGNLWVNIGSHLKASLEARGIAKTVSSYVEYHRSGSTKLRF